jgi:mannose/cellobiose epimerase-like protein (N-acyl-D-glucosamine 2-epimerase family)
MNWLTSPAHQRWLDLEMDRLLEFGRRSRDPHGGFGWLHDDGALDTKRAAELWVTCRMIHTYSLSHLMGRPGDGALVDHGLAALRGRFRDAEHGGWFAAVDAKGPKDSAKEAYGHAFVILAAASATAAERPGARELLEDALEISEERFWDDDAGMVRESFTRDWSTGEKYRGTNANMHTVEAYLAAADALGSAQWLRRAVRILDRAVNNFARENDWRLPEHFTEDWVPIHDYNGETPAHPFRPFGTTVGHSFEWARLTVQATASTEQGGMAAADWMIPAALSLYGTAVRDGWEVDGAQGFVYTLDQAGTPVVRERLHWVAAEAIGAAAVLYRRTRAEKYADDYRRWWEYVGEFHLDRQGGSWWHELGADNLPSHTVWSGKPDLYHAVQATLIPRLPVSPALAVSLAAGNLM